MMRSIVTLSAAALAATAICPAHAQSAADPEPAAEPPFETLMPENEQARAFQESFGYSEAVIVGDMIWLSGVVAGPAPGEDSLEPGFTRAFEHIGSILERAGASWDDVVLFDTFHTDLAGQIEEFAAVKNRYVRAPFPAWTALQISALFDSNAVVEIKVAARRPAAE